MAESPDHDQSETRSIMDSAISCNCCRSRKLRCSREFPTCQQCLKTGSQCEYKREKGKPGMKPGAIESLHRRLDQMDESIQQLRSANDENRPRQSSESTVQNVMAILAREVHRLSSAQSAPSPQDETVARGEEHERGQQRKRRRLQSPESSATLGGMPPLPPRAVLDQVIGMYFSRVHPWMPMLQEFRFKQRLDDAEERPKLCVILQAMTVATIRYVDGENFCGMTMEMLEACRNWVVATAISSLMIESLQALTIIAFNDIGNGRAMKAWPIVGSLTRTVEYLQLSVERDDATRPPPLSKPYVTVALREECTSWIELEERRRVFWAIFNLDRFCSISMGWNTSLTSDDVCRRLPCDISLWWQDKHVLTPYFNIWDKSAGRIGNPIPSFPSHSKSKNPEELGTPEVDHIGCGASRGPPSSDTFALAGFDNLSHGGDGGGGNQQSNPLVGKSTIGAFAYSVEATESLNQVTTYFLQQRVNMCNERDIELWLTRFKELDLRLIHWKMLLPQKWKPEMGRRYQTTRMDPNLTLAHVTHNASIVLLHQAIAFPRLDWWFRNRLPSLSSAETCHAAAVMVAAIANNYLTMLPSLPVTHLFAFCIFVCGRSLLAHWRYYAAIQLSPEFDSLVDSLDRISAQWRGLADGPATSNDNLAALYASRLRGLRQRCLGDENFRIDPSNYTMDGGDADETWSASPGGHVPQHFDMMAAAGTQARHSRLGEGQTTSPRPETSMLQSSSLAYHRDQQYRVHVEVHQTPYNPLAPDAEVADGMDSISQLFLNPQFVNVDRIIGLDDDIFDVGLLEGAVSSS